MARSRKHPWMLLLALVAVPISACGAGESADSTVTFLDRTIDLQPYLEGFPYSGWDADFDADRLFYFHETPEGRFLMTQPLELSEGRVDPDAGTRVTDIDWASRNFWGMEHDSLRGGMILAGDERNDEVINLYRLELEDGSISKLTDVPYIYGWSFSKDYERIGYIARYGGQEPYRNCLTLLDPGTGEQEEVLCEEGSEYRMVWSGVNFTPDGTGVVLKVNRDGQRKQGNLAYIDLTADDPSMEILLPSDVERFSHRTYDDWPADDTFYYVSDETGYANLYAYDLAARQSRQVTEVEEQASMIPAELDGRQAIVTMLDRPHETVLVVTDPATGEELGRQVYDFNLGVIGFDEEDTFVVSKTSAATPFRGDELHLRSDDGGVVFEERPLIRMPDRLVEAIEQCDVERVEYPTFDIDPATGERRLLHAFLMTPKNPLDDPAERLAVITSFYGGGNYFSETQHVFCEAGIAWLSPAVRGSSGFGKEFGALNDRDLGGDEIIDLFYGARFLEERLGLEPEQIGVAGGSHGGYATMRALTFPPHTNDRGESYPFGFGMSHAGFSSIVTFYDATNIPDWIILEAGDPATERAKLEDRSPLQHVDRLESPILLTHGSNDSRVGVSESRQFVEAARALNRPVTYVEFEGQGHGIKGLDNTVRYYQVRFDFLEEVVQGNRDGEEGDGTSP